MMIRIILKAIINHVIRPVVLFYLSSERNYRHGDIHLIIKPGVFHPGLFFSTKLLLKYLKNIGLDNRTLLELGAGSGLISIYAAKQKALVTATDISQTAVETIKQNAEQNNVFINVFKSDLFKALPRQSFEIIVINPPYYPGTPIDNKDFAWYCGKNYEYFDNLFLGLNDYIHSDSKVLMILSDQADIKRITEIAGKRNFLFHEVFRKTILCEQNFIFEIRRNK